VALAACAGPSHKPAEPIRVVFDSPVFEPSSVTGRVAPAAANTALQLDRPAWLVGR
jgi:hypothetical protein